MKFIQLTNLHDDPVYISGKDILRIHYPLPNVDNPRAGAVIIDAQGEYQVKETVDEVLAILEDDDND